MINWIEKIFFPIIKLTNKVGLVILFIMMLLTVADVIGRYFFSLPIAGSFELIEIMLSLLVFSSLAYTQIHKGHITIDIFVSRLSPKKKTRIESVTYFLCLVLSLLLTWQLASHAKRLWLGKNVSGVLEIPYFPVVIINTFGSGLHFFVLLVDFLRSFVKVLRHEF